VSEIVFGTVTSVLDISETMQCTRSVNIIIENSWVNCTKTGSTHHVLAVSATGATWYLGLNVGWTVQKWLNRSRCRLMDPVAWVKD